MDLVLLDKDNIQKMFNKHHKLIPRQYQTFKIKSHVKRKKKDSIHVYLRVNNPGLPNHVKRMYKEARRSGMICHTQ